MKLVPLPFKLLFQRVSYCLKNLRNPFLCWESAQLCFFWCPQHHQFDYINFLLRTEEKVTWSSVWLVGLVFCTTLPQKNCCSKSFETSDQKYQKLSWTRQDKVQAFRNHHHSIYKLVNSEHVLNLKFKKNSNLIIDIFIKPRFVCARNACLCLFIC